jgi:transcription antitermination factor NusG
VTARGSKLYRMSANAEKQMTHFVTIRRQIRYDMEPIKPAPLLPDVPGNWVVAYTAPKGEARAAEGLARIGFRTWYPQMTRWNRSGWIKSRKHHPLFPRYVFVAVTPEHRRMISECRDVLAVLTGDGGRLAADRRRLLEISALQQAGTFDETARPIKDETMVRITEGPFRGWTGKVLGMSDVERVKVMLTILGRETQMDVLLDHVEQIS